MKKLLMTAALLVVGATAFGASAPVNVSLSVVQTSQLVIMDGGNQLNQIDLTHQEILLSSAKNATSPSVAKQNFIAQTGDNSPITVANAQQGTTNSIEYTLEGVDSTTGELKLKGATAEIKSTLTLSRASDSITSGTSTSGATNTITSTIPAIELNKLTAAGTYAGTSKLIVTLK